MDDLKTHLEILELKPGATKAEIKTTFRDLSKVWHPDRFDNDPRLRFKAQEKIKQINEAYSKLKNCQSLETKPEAEKKSEVTITKVDLFAAYKNKRKPQKKFDFETIFWMAVAILMFICFFIYVFTLPGPTKKHRSALPTPKLLIERL